MISQRENGTGQLIFESQLIDAKCSNFNCVQTTYSDRTELTYYHKTKGGSYTREMLLFLLLNPHE